MEVGGLHEIEGYAVDPHPLRVRKRPFNVRASSPTMGDADGPSITETYNAYLSLRSVGVAGLRFESHMPFPQFCTEFKRVPN